MQLTQTVDSQNLCFVVCCDNIDDRELIFKANLISLNTQAQRFPSVSSLDNNEWSTFLLLNGALSRTRALTALVGPLKTQSY